MMTALTVQWNSYAGKYCITQHKITIICLYMDGLGVQSIARFMGQK